MVSLAAASRGYRLRPESLDPGRLDSSSFLFGELKLGLPNIEVQIAKAVKSVPGLLAQGQSHTSRVLVVTSLYRSGGKRSLDFLASSIGLVITAPICLFIAIAIRLDDGGPAIFTQERVGSDEQLFRIHKFRSMPVGNADIPSAHADALPITRVGRFLRRSNLDEIPQLVNVLMGTMSLVGPRPALPSQIELIELRRLNGVAAVLPGLTGLAQVNGYDGMADEVKANFDAQYAAKITLKADIVILLRTLGYLLKPPPRY